ncbi:MAG: hypothetical protein DMG81_09165 [Acidobacteria bacterium]|nr:MAG: hypothetical protein DMG81_09165 [Acidobacteriota bacterium]
MAASRNKSQESRFLSSWKEIANYMGKGVRTVQRYEAQFGLPVRRPAGKSRAAVIATRAEIDAWIAASPIRETFRLNPSFEVPRAPELNAIRDGIREMHALREQMTALRSETRSSLRLLISSLHTLRQGTAKEDRKPEDLFAAALRVTSGLTLPPAKGRDQDN